MSTVGWESWLGLAACGLALRRNETTASMAADRDLDVLMARYQAGDFAAATTLIETVSPQLHRFFVVQLSSRADADDLLQETWLRIHKVRHTYRSGEPVLAWFYAIARYVRIDHYRRTLRAKVRELPFEEDGKTAEPRPHETVGGVGLEALLGTLPASQREVIELLKVEGLSLEEVARATSSSVGAVKQKAHRAYQKLREVFVPEDRKTPASGE